ncbi:MAG: hypothetical protein ACREM1_20175 [Longimicrobiales bacterium]
MRWLVIKEAAAPVMAGTAAGVVIALGAGRVIAREFLGVAAADVTALGVSIAVMVMIAGVAASIPAFRASRVDPRTALRAN